MLNALTAVILPSDRFSAMSLPHLAVLNALTSITLSGVPTASDETLRLVGQRHPAVAVLSLSACAALTGSAWAQYNAFPALRSLTLDGCDSVTG